MGRIKIRLHMMGRRNNKWFKIVVADTRVPTYRSSRFIEELGYYKKIVRMKPHQLLQPKEGVISPIEKWKEAYLNFDRVKYWLGRGAQVTQPAQKILSAAGVLPPPEVPIYPGWDYKRDTKIFKQVEKYHLEKIRRQAEGEDEEEE